MTIHIDEYMGELSLAAEKMLEVANREGDQVTYEFNGVLLVANPGDTITTVSNRYRLDAVRLIIAEHRSEEKTLGVQPDGSMIVQVECSDCKTRGIILSTQHPHTAILCRRCAGEGWLYLTYKPFSQRRQQDGIQTVCLITTDESPAGQPISYEDFLAGKLPE